MYSSIRSAPVVIVLVWGLAACGADGPERGDGFVPGDPLSGEGLRVAGLPAEPRASATSRFWEHWGDGRAELASYRITVPRYGESRAGELVLIYVTEPHDRLTWIKDDGVEAPDRVEVVKLNVNLKFLTGIYPYSVMTSVFSPVDDWGGERFQPVKIGLTAQEWCGHYLHQMWPGADAVRSLRISYFASDGESLTRSSVPEGALYEDALLIQLRELDGPFAEGGDWRGPMVPSLWNIRRGVGSPEPVEATITREEVVDADDRTLTRFTVRYGDFVGEYDVEEEYPHRIVEWRTSVGDTARLVATRRLPYWNQNDVEGWRQRVELGLSPNSSGLPPGIDEGPSERTGASLTESVVPAC